MYSRSYYPDGVGKVNLPQNYDGTAFIERESPEQEDSVQASFIDSPQGERDQKEESFFKGLSGGSVLSGLFSKGGLLGGLNLKIPEIGTEEILLIAIAAFLFFSKDGDKESAIFLLLLLLIN